MLKLLLLKQVMLFALKLSKLYQPMVCNKICTGNKSKKYNNKINDFSGETKQQTHADTRFCYGDISRYVPIISQCLQR